MSALGDAMQAIKDVVLMQAGLDRMAADLARVGEDLRDLRRGMADIDKRVVRIETMIEFSTGRGPQPRIEGN